jgi:hypothetical protein
MNLSEHLQPDQRREAWLLSLARITASVMRADRPEHPELLARLARFYDALQALCLEETPA